MPKASKLKARGDKEAAQKPQVDAQYQYKSQKQNEAKVQEHKGKGW
ncbi:hypothetical protein HBZC1_02470 [Helicobacter bizzozeronii CIII-1]|uniref:Uncharacterized protein n=1 Tax=Helicobacter bizzozeronii (strain CIII-1) TaxID=1002804 RepID=F8KR59_HELBC|nr:hypothetical protein HBZC1_02470 [Helicobacter bizzozeronii CIII-1]